MHNHKKEHFGNTILFSKNGDHFWIADGYVSSLNINDSVLAYISPMHPTPYPIIFTKHYFYAYCGNFEMYPQTSASKIVQNIVRKYENMKNSKLVTANEQAQLEAFYKKYECAHHRSKRILKQVVICSSVNGSQLYARQSTGVSYMFLSTLNHYLSLNGQRKHTNHLS